MPEKLGAISRDWLEQHGYAVKWHSYPMPHSVSGQEIADVRAFLMRDVFAHD